MFSGGNCVFDMIGPVVRGRRKQYDVDVAVDNVFVRIEANEHAIIIDSELIGTLFAEAFATGIERFFEEIPDGDNLDIGPGCHSVERRTAASAPAPNESNADRIICSSMYFGNIRRNCFRNGD